MHWLELPHSGLQNPWLQVIFVDLSRSGYNGCNLVHSQAKILGKKAVPNKTSDTHPLNGYTFPKTDVAKSPTDVTQAYAKSFLPPKSYIWRGNFGDGAWHGSYVHECKRKSHHSAPWIKFGNDSWAAAVEIIRWAWKLYLEEHNLPDSHCPIKGLLGA